MNFGIATGKNWPGRAKEVKKLLADRLPFAELRDGKFRRHHQCPVLAELWRSKSGRVCIGTSGGFHRNTHLEVIREAVVEVSQKK